MRFSRIVAADSISTELLQDCPVVTADGSHIGTVDALLIDRKSRQLRYVLLDERGSARKASSAAVAIPWHALYFDSAMARLVFYTYSY